MKIARIFPRRTKYSPDDANAYFGPPTLITPFYEEAHISVLFTWDLQKAKDLAVQWRKHAQKVRIGGPAVGDRGGKFIPGQYVKHGVVITHRGCCNHCWFCDVWQREGNIRELPITPGYITFDSNLFACSKSHIAAVFDMFLSAKGVLHNASVSAVKTSIGVAMKMKRAGYKKGFPDMQICEPRGQYHGMFIELKCGTYSSQEQKEWRDDLLKRGYLAIIVPGNMDYREAQEYL
jgi:hypothetical protein